jgi:hypothetical protein
LVTMPSYNQHAKIIPRMLNYEVSLNHKKNILKEHFKINFLQWVDDPRHPHLWGAFLMTIFLI